MLLLVLLRLLLLPRKWWSCSEECDEKMRRICRIMNRKDVGSLGIDAMIVFIAMILVAGVAATVFIKSAGQFELQSMKTAQDTVREVSGGLTVVNIEGRLGTFNNGTAKVEWSTNNASLTKGNLSYLAIIVQSRPGSGSIDLNNTFILLSNEYTKTLLRYAYMNSSDVFKNKAATSGNIFTVLNDTQWDILDGELYGIIVLQDADGSLKQYTPVLNRGDKAALLVRCNSSATFDDMIQPRTNVWGQVKPESGSPGVISFTTPMSYPVASFIFDLQ
jgi:flagellin FlaB